MTPSQIINTYKEAVKKALAAKTGWGKNEVGLILDSVASVLGTQYDEDEKLETEDENWRDLWETPCGKDD